MNNFVFYSPTEFVFGKDTDIQTGTLAKKYNARKAMIVYGGGSIIRSGLLQRIEDSLQQAGVDYVKLGGVQPNPTDPKVYEGIELARKEGVDFMLPVGGGSVIDTAKAIAAGVPYEGDFWDFRVAGAGIRRQRQVLHASVSHRLDAQHRSGGVRLQPAATARPPDVRGAKHAAGHRRTLRGVFRSGV